MNQHIPAPWNKDKAVGQKHSFTLPQIKLITRRLEHAKRFRDLGLFCLGIDTMLRGSDLVRLRVGDVMSKNRHPKSEFAWSQLKTGNPVVAAISPYAQSAVCCHVASAKLGHDDFLFGVTRNGKTAPLSTSSLRRLVKKWAILIDLDPENYASHSLRRSKSAHLYAQGVRPEMLRLLLGHSSIQSTQAYLGIDRNQALSLAKQHDCFKES